MTDPASLRAAARGVRTIVHLVAIVEGAPATFERVMAAGTGNLVEAARESGVRRIVLMSALGTGPGATVPYFRAKWAAEQAVRDCGIEHVVLRPSFVFGTDGGVLPRFLRIARLSPVTPVIGPGTQRVQPIWIDDLVRAVRLAVEGDAVNATVEARRPARGHVERAVGADEGGARNEAADDTRPLLARTRAGCALRAPSHARRSRATSSGCSRARDNVVSDGGRVDAQARARRPASRSTSSLVEPAALQRERRRAKRPRAAQMDGPRRSVHSVGLVEALPA